MHVTAVFMQKLPPAAITVIVVTAQREMHWCISVNVVAANSWCRTVMLASESVRAWLSDI
jgi:hypothetical protein